MFLYTSSNSLNYCGIFILNMFCKCFLFYTGYLFFSDLSFLFNLLTGFLWSMVKAYSVGTSICHTTNILTIYRFWIVQRFKPPSFLFRSSLSRQDFYRWFLRNYSIKSSYTNFDLTFLGYFRLFYLNLKFVDLIFDLIFSLNFFTELFWFFFII